MGILRQGYEIDRENETATELESQKMSEPYSERVRELESQKMREPFSERVREPENERAIQ